MYRVFLILFLLPFSLSAQEHFERDSLFVSHFDDGKLASVGPFLDGEKHGYWQYNAPNGELWMEVLFIHGRMSNQTNYLETAPEQPEMNRVVRPSVDTLTSLDYWYKYFLFYSDSIHPYQPGDMYVLRNLYEIKSPLSGGEKEYVLLEHFLPNPEEVDRDSLLQIDVQLLDRRGKNEHFAIVRSAIHRNGTPWTLFQISKNKTAEVHHLKNGNGLYTACYQNGERWMEVPFYKGFASGAVHYYSPSGKLDLAGWFEQGQRTGQWIFYYPNGNIHRQLTYREGAFAGQYRSYYPNGKVRIQAVLIDGDLGIDPLDPINGGAIFDGLAMQFIETNSISYFKKDGTPSYQLPVAMVHETMYHQRKSGMRATTILRGTDF